MTTGWSDVVTRARELRDGGASFRVTAEILTAEGYPTKKGGPWHAGTVYRLLQPPPPPLQRPGGRTARQCKTCTRARRKGA